MTDSDTAQGAPEPPQIRLLRRLVTVLTLTMTFGMIIIVGLMIWRLGPTSQTTSLPDTIPLPMGETLTGYAQNPDWLVLITTDADSVQRLHLVRPGAETIHQSVQIQPR